MQMLRLLLLLCAGSAAAGAYTCPAYCASQTRAGDCQAGEDAVLRAACVCDWVYRGSTRGCVRDFGGFVCDGKQDYASNGACVEFQVSVPTVRVHHIHSHGAAAGTSVEGDAVVLVVVATAGLLCILGCWYFAWDEQAARAHRW